jgi:glycosyltransferase involved in cell wall biosynthesis
MKRDRSDGVRAESPAGRNILIAIPAYNEAATIGEVVRHVREHLPGYDLLVINDGSRDDTSRILARLGVSTATHFCNLGYGRALQTAIKYALRGGWDALVTLDADGQHHPDQLPGMVQAFIREQWDCLIGSRYIRSQDYSTTPLGRRVGMQLFSLLTGLLVGKRIYDTTSGLKILGRQVFEPLVRWHFVDFHAEAIVYLARLGFRVGEYPISVEQRRHGVSMYTALSYVGYPLKTCTMVFLAAVQAGLTRRREGS